MAGRLPFLTDEAVDGTYVLALKRRGWVLAIEVFGEMTDDETLFAHAAAQDRVSVEADEESG